jgi:GNAT superfamily N-acetyltransferase
MSNEKLVFKPVTLAEWPDMQKLFTSSNPFRRCWCMFWRSKRADFERGQGGGNRAAMEQLIVSGHVPGLLAYQAEEPVGWVSVAPREDFAALERSRTLKRIDNQPVWSIVCFVVSKEQRSKGMLAVLIRGAVDYAASQGARIVEAYPLIPEESSNPALSIYMGVVSTFEQLGFKEMAQPSRMRMMMRYTIEGG